MHALLHRLNLPKRDARHIAAAVVDGAAPGSSDCATEELAASEIVGLAEPDHPDAPLLALALADLRLCASTSTASSTSSSTSAAPSCAELGLGESPRVGEILAELRRRKLNGELDGRESELAAARELIEAP